MPCKQGVLEEAPVRVSDRRHPALLQACSCCMDACQRTPMEQRVRPPTTSTAHGTMVSDSIKAIVESSMTLSQSINSCIPPSSSSSDSELNNALPVLLNNKNDSQENAVESARYIFDPLSL